MKTETVNLQDLFGLEDNLDCVCPNCDKPFDGIECDECGFDAYSFDQNYDLD